MSVFYFKGRGGNVQKSHLKQCHMLHGEPHRGLTAPATTGMKRPCARASPMLPLPCKGPCQDPPHPEGLSRHQGTSRVFTGTRLLPTHGWVLPPAPGSLSEEQEWARVRHPSRIMALTRRCACVGETRARGRGQHSARALLLPRLGPVPAAGLTATLY